VRDVVRCAEGLKRQELNFGEVPMNKVYLMDCMEYLKDCKDNQFQLSIVDPPYGIDINMNMGRKKGQPKAHDKKEWDKSIPDEKYFNELFRTSEHQIIWGGNYFPLPLVRGWIFWDKNVPTGVSFADGELAWSNFDTVLRKCFIPYSGFQGSEGKIHPTQKPVALYKWLLKNYAKPGDKILDTHIGSGSIRIACYDMGFDLTGCELDESYFIAQEARFQNHISQADLFGVDEIQELIFKE